MEIIKNDCEMITISLIRQIIDAKEHGEAVMIQLETDERFYELNDRNPLKSEEERIKLASSIEGVDFVQIGNDILKTEDEEENPKSEYEFQVGYVPGTYDLLHTGHIENIKFAKERCKLVVVGVNSDDLVWVNKRKQTKQTEKTRLFVMKHVKGVSMVILTTTNDKSLINEIVMKELGLHIEAIFLGEDLKGKECNEEGNLEDVEYIYTKRPNKKMETISSTAERLQIERLTRKIEELEKKNENLKNLLKEINEQIDD